MRKNSGFNLIELMMVIAVIGIIAAIAFPQYHHYISRSRASGAMVELEGYRVAVADCANERQTLSGCTAGLNGVPSIPLFTTKNLVETFSVADGIIEAKTGATSLQSGEYLTVVDTPSYFSGQLRWLNTGTTCDSIRGFKSGQGHCP